MPRPSPSLSQRVAGLFACHFFGFGLFLPFIPVVLEFQGISPAEIGFVLGVGTILRIAASPLLANLSDRTGQRRLSILIYSLIGAASVALFALPGGLLVAGAAVISYMVFKAPVLPLSDAYALDVARNTGTDYARMRLWGSAGFVAANLAGGALAAQATSWIILALIALASLATGFVAMSMPPQRREEPGDEQGGETPTAPFKSVWFWPVLAVLGLFQASHAAFYGFGTLYWQAKGVPDFAIGSLWAVGVVAEIALFTIAGKLAHRFDPPVFLLVAGIAAVFRWSLFPFADTLAAMAALQLLHAFTFGAAHLGAVAILARVIPSKWAGTGQGLLGTSIGIQMAVGLSVCGALYDVDPDMPFYLMAGVSVFGAMAMLALTPLVRRCMDTALQAAG
ncbi:MFS transporter [Roseibium salinum]|uniref:MFS transporter n=1 Tax=Roseibium salinum TaxID=1604349 RepID=A0ABT3QYV1_9HYPH|nr:MFS transporter [Roseibium sp. DSM 29163]MCX2722018.1 MFS transporter [Roseibium sp. DSM 29163]